MKPIIIAFIIAFAFSTTAKSQTVYTFMVDQATYKVEEKVLNDLFGAAFNDLVAKNVTSEKDFDLWVRSYEMWKLPALRGTFRFLTYGDRIANISFLVTLPQCI